MKKLIYLLLLLSTAASAQQNNTTNTKFINGLAAPNGATPVPTSGLTAGAIFYKTGVGFQYYDGTAWQTVGLSGGGVTSFNTRTGAVTLTSGDVTTALGFTPGQGTVTSVTAGTGLTPNTSQTSVVAFMVDTAAIQTVANFFPKGDTRWAKITDLAGYLPLTAGNTKHLTGMLYGDAGLTFTGGSSYITAGNTGATLGLSGDLNVDITGGTYVTLGAPSIYFSNLPSTSAGGYSILTRNTSTGKLEVVPSSSFGVTSVSGTSNRITSTGGTTPVIDISASYVGQTSLTTLGTITTGTWNGNPIANAYLANSSISFTNGATGTAPSFSVSPVSLGSSTQLNIPLASGSGVTSGTISKTNYDKFNSAILPGDTSVFARKIGSDNISIFKNGNSFTQVSISNTNTGASASSGIITYAADSPGAIDPGANYGQFRVFPYSASGNPVLRALNNNLYIASGGDTKRIQFFLDGGGALPEGEGGIGLSVEKPLLTGQRFSYDIFIPTASYTYSRPSAGVGFGWNHPNIARVDSFSRAITIVGQSVGTLELVNNGTVSNGTTVGSIYGYSDTLRTKTISRVDFVNVGSNKNSGKVNIGTYLSGVYGIGLTIDENHNTIAAGSVTVPDVAYGSGWNGDLSVPTKNAIWDAGFLDATTASSTYLPLAGGTLTGALTISTTTNPPIFSTGKTTQANYFQLGNSGSTAKIGQESSSGGTTYTGTTAYATIIGNSSNVPVQFATNGVVRQTIDGSGNTTFTGTVTGVGAGNLSGSTLASGVTASSLTSAGSTFTLASAAGGDGYLRLSNTGGNFTIGRQTTAGNLLTGAPANATVLNNGNSTNPIVIGVNDAVALTIANGGTLTTTLGTGAVQSTAGVLSVVSSGKFKDWDYTRKIPNALNLIGNLESPNYYHWNDKSGLPKDVSLFGLDADKVHEVLGEEFAPTQPVQGGDITPTYGLQDRAIMSLMLQAIQELKKEVDTLKSK